MGEAKRRKEQFRKDPKPCVFCGVTIATTRDHIPPKGIFTPPRPQLITVPACTRCNESSSELDEEFKVFLGFIAGGGTANAAQNFWTRSAIPSIRANRQTMLKVENGASLWTRQPDGTFGLGKIIKLSANVHSKTVEKMTRGLYWHHFREILPSDCKINTYFFHGLSQDLLRLAMSIRRCNIGSDEIFVYAYARLESGEPISVWLYQFYKTHWAGAFTSTTDFEQKYPDMKQAE